MPFNAQFDSMSIMIFFVTTTTTAKLTRIQRKNVTFWLCILATPSHVKAIVSFPTNRCFFPSVTTSFFSFFYSQWVSLSTIPVSLFLFVCLSLFFSPFFLASHRLRLGNFQRRQNYAKLCSNGTLSSSSTITCSFASLPLLSHSISISLAFCRPQHKDPSRIMFRR